MLFHRGASGARMGHRVAIANGWVPLRFKHDLCADNGLFHTNLASTLHCRNSVTMALGQLE